MNEFVTGEILVETEEFADYGGWSLDSQFAHEMGSPYLLLTDTADLFDDAQTTIEVVTAGRYQVWARTKDWVPAHHPGRFNVAINGQVIEHECGSHGGDWVWEHIGEMTCNKGRSTLRYVTSPGSMEGATRSSSAQPAPNQLTE